MHHVKQGMLLINGSKYIEYSQKDEEGVFHPIVRALSKEIFGKDTIYFDVKATIKTASGIGSIPDAYVIDPIKQEWYVIENELASHPVYDHVIKQLTKFINGLDNQQSRNTILEMLYQEINSDNKLRLDILTKTNAVDLYHFLSKLFIKNPRLIVVIDKLTEDLEDAVSALRFRPIIIEIKTYAEETNPKNRVFLFEPIYPAKHSEIKETSNKKITDKSNDCSENLAYDDILKECSQEVQTIASTLTAKINNLSGILSKVSGRNYVFNYEKTGASGRFAAFMPRRQALAIRIRTDSSNYPDLQNLIGGKTYHWFFTNGIGEEREFRVTTLNQVDYAFELIKRSYELADN
jgi:hypothetical protein